MKRILVLLAFFVTALAVPQSTDGHASHLSARSLSELRSFKKMRFLVPTWIPRGFTVNSSVFEDRRDPRLLSWTLTYSNRTTHARFVVQMCSDGIGDVMFSLPNGEVVEPTSHLHFSSRALGKGDLEVYAKGREKQWQVSWIELKSKPVFVSAMGYGMSGADGKRIVESLEWLR